MYNLEILEQGCEELGITLSDTQKNQFIRFYEYLVEKNKAYREKYDLCVSRAVSGLATLSEYCLPYVKVGGLFVSYKSGSVKEEAEAAEKAVKILGGKIRDIQYFDLPGSEIGRSLVIIEKVKNTPGKYPRKAGTPLREPLA